MSLFWRKNIYCSRLEFKKNILNVYKNANLLYTGTDSLHSEERRSREPRHSTRPQVLKVLSNEKRGGLKVV